LETESIDVDLEQMSEVENAIQARTVRLERWKYELENEKQFITERIQDRESISHQFEIPQKEMLIDPMFDDFINEISVEMGERQQELELYEEQTRQANQANSQRRMQLLDEMKQKVIQIRKYRRKLRIIEIGKLKVAEWTEFVDGEKHIWCELHQELKKTKKRIQRITREDRQNRSDLADTLNRLLEEEKEHHEIEKELRIWRARITEGEEEYEELVHSCEYRERQVIRMEMEVKELADDQISFTDNDQFRLSAFAEDFTEQTFLSDTLTVLFDE
jgi:hypothetical protein